MNYKAFLKGRFKVEHAAFIGMLGIFAAMVLWCYWSFWPPYSYVFSLTKPIKILTPQVTAGNGVLSYELNYCKNPDYNNLHAFLQYTFVDHIIQSSAPTLESLPSGCHTVIIDLALPPLRAGVYTLLITQEYNLSPIRHVSETYTTDKFTVNTVSEVPVQELQQLVTLNQLLEQRLSKLLNAHQELVKANKKLLEVNGNLLRKFPQ